MPFVKVDPLSVLASYVTLVNSDYTATVNSHYFSQGNQPQPSLVNLNKIGLEVDFCET